MAKIDFKTIIYICIFLQIFTYTALQSKVELRRLDQISSKCNLLHIANGVIQTSDRRAKKEIVELEYGLREIMALNPVSYYWKDKKNKDRKVGLIAQEIFDVLPETVLKPKNQEDFLGVNYGEIVPVLIKAIQEQQQQIDELTEDNATLMFTLNELVSLHQTKSIKSVKIVRTK